MIFPGFIFYIHAKSMIMDVTSVLYVKSISKHSMRIYYSQLALAALSNIYQI